jgi:hypothetical protein
MVEFAIKRLNSGGLITNYFCTSNCGHCLYNCSPLWEKRYVEPQTVRKNIEAVRALGCRSVHIGGGEPLLKPDQLGRVLEIADETGISVDYVETNSSWFRDRQSAEDLLARLYKKGLRTLLISISPFHNERIPYARVQGVMAAARRAGVSIFPWIADFISDLSRFDPAETHSLDEYRQAYGDNYLMQILQRYWIHLGGRALETFRPLLAKKDFHQILADNPGGCAAELGDTSHFHIDLFGNYIPGLCAGLAIFRDDLGKRLSDERYPLITTLVRHGICGLVELAGDLAGYAPQKKYYVNKCDVCSEVRTFLALRGRSGLNELNPVEFYLRQ